MKKNNRFLTITIAIIKIITIITICILSLAIIMSAHLHMTHPWVYLIETFFLMLSSSYVNKFIYGEILDNEKIRNNPPLLIQIIKESFSKE